MASRERKKRQQHAILQEMDPGVCREIQGSLLLYWCLEGHIGHILLVEGFTTPTRSP